ncbi:MAG TPA: hypothetical protein VJH91_03555 [Candidatus Paceibacterota bacterium]
MADTETFTEETESDTAYERLEFEPALEAYEVRAESDTPETVGRIDLIDTSDIDDPALRDILEYKGGMPEDWELTHVGKDEYIFTGSDIVNAKTGESWTEQIGTTASPEEMAMHQEMFHQWSAGGEQLFRLPDYVEQTPDGELLSVTHLILGPDMRVSYEIRTTLLRSAEEEDLLFDTDRFDAVALTPFKFAEQSTQEHMLVSAPEDMLLHVGAAQESSEDRSTGEAFVHSTAEHTSAIERHVEAPPSHTFFIDRSIESPVSENVSLKEFFDTAPLGHLPLTLDSEAPPDRAEVAPAQAAVTLIHDSEQRMAPITESAPATTAQEHRRFDTTEPAVRATERTTMHAPESLPVAEFGGAETVILSVGSKPLERTESYSTELAGEEVRTIQEHASAFAHGEVHIEQNTAVLSDHAQETPRLETTSSTRIAHAPAQRETTPLVAEQTLSAYERQITEFVSNTEEDPGARRVETSVETVEAILRASKMPFSPSAVANRESVRGNTARRHGSARMNARTVTRSDRRVSRQGITMVRVA